jgi:hypothetical protein
MPTPEASVSRINCPLDMGYARIGASHEAFSRCKKELIEKSWVEIKTFQM